MRMGVRRLSRPTHPWLQPCVWPGKHRGLELRKPDSGIVMEVLETLPGRGTAALREHDSVGWVDEHKDKVRVLKENVYVWHMGFRIAVNW